MYVCVFVQDRHLLILLSNMHYMMAEVVPRVFTCFLSQGYSSSIDLQDVSIVMLTYQYILFSP